MLDQVGAEQLLGRGDMLYVGSGTSIPLRVHGAYVGEEEIIRVVKDWKDKETVKYLDEVTKAPKQEKILREMVILKKMSFMIKQ